MSLSLLALSRPHRSQERDPLDSPPAPVPSGWVDAAQAVAGHRLAPPAARGASPEVFDLAARIARLFPALRAAIPSRISLRVEVPPVPVWVRMDVETLHELVRELVSASVSAIPRFGTVWVTAWTGSFSDLRPAACLRVEGTGTTSLKGALGLPQRPDPGRYCEVMELPGLAAVLAAVLEAEADVQVECADAVGTTISLRFPLATGSPD